MDNIRDLAERNQKKAHQIIRDLNVVEIWNSIGAEVHLVGSLKMGLLMKHRDIDFHIYSDPVVLHDSMDCVRMKRVSNGMSGIEITMHNFGRSI